MDAEKARQIIKDVFAARGLTVNITGNYDERVTITLMNAEGNYVLEDEEFGIYEPKSAPATKEYPCTSRVWLNEKETINPSLYPIPITIRVAENPDTHMWELVTFDIPNFNPIESSFEKLENLIARDAPTKLIEHSIVAPNVKAINITIQAVPYLFKGVGS